MKKWRRWALVAVLGVAAFELALRLTPFPRELLAEPAESTELVDREGRPLREVLAEERRYSRHVALAEVSSALVQATLAAEDKRYFSHPGVDPLAGSRALWQLARGHAPRSGASTITMQLVKIARAEEGSRTFARKFTEAWFALRVERAWPKERILAGYLNRLEYGQLQVGIAAASRHYFGKPPSDLTSGEAAYLAALPKAPSRLSRPGEAQARAAWIAQRISTVAVEPKISAPPFAAPAFVDLLLQRRGLLPERGGTVKTTLDLSLNRFAEQALRENLRDLADKNATAGAVVVLDNRTGDVLALASVSTAEAGAARDVNTAWMIRSPGSAVKPFTYVLALEHGANPSTVVADVPTDFPTSTGSYRPSNYNHRFHGPVSLRQALGNSLNVAAIRALELGGGPAALQHALRQGGITTLDQPPDYYGLGLTLGNGEVRLLELANAYAALARLGEYRPFRFLARDDTTTGTRLFDRDAAWLLADMLSDNAARAASFGLDSSLHFAFPVACKTGTSSDYRDNWCLGFTPEFTVGVWVGNANGQPMRGITGVTGAAPVFHEVFERLHATAGTSWYAMPSAIQQCSVEPLTGHRVAEGTACAVREKVLRLPPLSTAEDYDAQGRVVLPAEYAAWLASDQNPLGQSVACATDSASPQLEPSPGSTFFLDPDLPAQSQRVALRCGWPAPQWESDTLALVHTGATTCVQLAEGRHLLRVRDLASGQTATTWIEVKSL